MLRMLRFAFHSRNLTGIHQIVERFRRGTFAIRDAFRFYNTAALLPLEAKLPLCDNYTELATCFSDVNELLQEVDRSLCESAASITESESRSSTMRRILLYINEHYADPDLSVGKISEVFGFNSNYISQLFKKSEQEGFTAYLTRIRMEHAMQLLRESDCQIREVGELSGYSDYFYFARVFKKHTGQSPGEYRAAPHSGKDSGKT